MKLAKVSLLSLTLLMSGCLFGNESTEVRPKGLEKVTLKGKEVLVEIADSPGKRSKGLMNRESLGENRGMLFIFESEQVLSFWMKNTLIPLSIGYFNKKGILIDIQQMEPESVLVRELKVYKSSGPAKFALEVNKGWFKKNNIEVGTQLVWKGLLNAAK